jgi:hypothetical protein
VGGWGGILGMYRAIAALRCLVAGGLGVDIRVAGSEVFVVDAEDEIVVTDSLADSEKVGVAGTAGQNTGVETDVAAVVRVVDCSEGQSHASVMTVHIALQTWVVLEPGWTAGLDLSCVAEGVEHNSVVVELIEMKWRRTPVQTVPRETM